MLEFQKSGKNDRDDILAVAITGVCLCEIGPNKWLPEWDTWMIISRKKGT